MRINLIHGRVLNLVYAKFSAATGAYLPVGRTKLSTSTSGTYVMVQHYAYFQEFVYSLHLRGLLLVLKVNFKKIDPQIGYLEKRLE